MPIYRLADFKLIALQKVYLSLSYKFQMIPSFIEFNKKKKQFD